MQRFVNNWSVQLSAPAGSADTLLQVDTAGLPELGAGDYLLATLALVEDGAETLWEIVKITGFVTGSVAVERGQEGTMPLAWPAGTPVSARATAGTLEELRDAGGGASVGDSEPLPLGVAAAGSSEQASREDHVHPLPSAVDIGAATAEQGELADSAVQPPELADALSGKVDVQPGFGLSEENYTPEEKAKLAGLEGSHYRGVFVDLAALQSAILDAVAGDYADVDGGLGSPVLRYIWDVDDIEWVPQAGEAPPLTASQVKVLYESNPDTNGYTNAEKSKLGGIAAGATANASTDALAEGSTNLYHTAARVRAVVLTGLSLLAASAIEASDSLLVALGKLQRQINDLDGAVSGKLSNPMTTAGDMIVGGASGAPARVAAGTAGQVLTMVAGSPAWAAPAGGGGGGVPSPVVTVTGTTRTVGVSDAGAYLRWTSASAKTLTVAPQATAAWADDTEIHVRNAAASNLTLAAGAGVTLNAPYLGTLLVPPGGAVTLKRAAADTWDVVGGTVAA